MTSRDKCKSVHIDITTYNNLNNSTSMNGKMYHKNNVKKSICDLCLHCKPDKEHLPKKTQKTCPICQRKLSANQTAKCVTENIRQIHPGNSNSKEVQTTQSDVNPNLDLLDEVLKVFKSKKDVFVNKCTKVFKDVETSTVELNGKAKLTRSKVFLLSIGENTTNDKLKCAVVNSYPYEGNKSIELIKHKSSSIPQMKMDELKFALRVKTKSKDAIEEVNRMFATVRKYDLKNSNDSNRPMIRNGPRILPVVKTKPVIECKYCLVNRMSSGDSAYECCHHNIEDKCDKCVYMLCCHYKNNKKLMQNDVVLCENCKEKHSCDKYSNDWDESN